MYIYPQQTKKKRKGKQKGVVYEDEGSDVDDSTLAPDQHGRPTWRMEDRNTLTSIFLIPCSLHVHVHVVYIHIHVQ